MSHWSNRKEQKLYCWTQARENLTHIAKRETEKEEWTNNDDNSIARKYSPFITNNVPLKMILKFLTII